MGHPALDNRTPFVCEPMFAADEEGRPILTTIVKATFDLRPDRTLVCAEKQEPIAFAGKPLGDEGKSGWQREPEIAFVKPSTDCVLLGHAISRRPAPHVDVGFRVGPVQKMARVYGDRYWDVSLLGQKPSAPKPFERMPLTWDRAFGGWDRTPEDEKHHEFEPRNPLGIGLVAKRGKQKPGAPLPNLESVDAPMKSPTARPAPVGFGFTGPQWQPRAKFAGTYGEAWEKQRAPRLPVDFDRRFFQGAADGLTTPKPLVGDEAIIVVGATEDGRVEFRLPGIGAPTARIVLRHGKAIDVVTVLDTVIVDTDLGKVVLLWRAPCALRQGPSDVAAITLTATNLPPRADARIASAVPRSN